MIINSSIKYFIFSCFIFLSANSAAKGTYQLPDDFINRAFTEQAPEPQLIWIKGDLRDQIEAILQHKYKAKRVRYWKKNQRSVWILDEIGKKKPITVGIIIDDHKIAKVKVLVFRETRGWEVKYPFFTRQFSQLKLTKNHTLSQSIDGISGATISVRAINKLARISLLLNQAINSL